MIDTKKLRTLERLLLKAADLASGARDMAGDLAEDTRGLTLSRLEGVRDACTRIRTDVEASLRALDELHMLASRKVSPASPATAPPSAAKDTGPLELSVLDGDGQLRLLRRGGGL